MSERQLVEVDLDKLRARMLAAPVTEEQIDLLFALIEDMQRQFRRVSQVNDESLALLREVEESAGLESQLGEAHAEIARLEAALKQAATMKTIKGARRIVEDAIGERSGNDQT